MLIEMIEELCADMFSKGVVSLSFSWWVSYDYKSLEEFPGYSDPISVDFYGRLHPHHNNGVVKARIWTNSFMMVRDAILAAFDAKTDHRLLFWRLGVCANEVDRDELGYQLDFFTDYQSPGRERRIQGAMAGVRKRFAPNTVFKGMNMLKGVTLLERNQQIGGHRA